MQELIEQGIRQGTVICFAEDISEKDNIVNCLKASRFGQYSNSGVGKTHVLLVLTQECGISSRDTIEVVQGKKERKFDESTHPHLTEARDYKKLVMKINGDFYSFKESLLAKVEQKELLRALKEERVFVSSKIEPWQKRRLLDWRTLEYTREPFPDKFNRAFSEYRDGKGNWFTNFLLINQENIDSIRIFLTPEDDGAEQYHVSFCALLTSSCTEQSRTEIVEMLDKMSEELTSEAPFITSLQSDSYNGDLILPSGVMIAFSAEYDEFTFENAYEMREFNLEFLCY